VGALLGRAEAGTTREAKGSHPKHEPAGGWLGIVIGWTVQLRTIIRKVPWLWRIVSRARYMPGLYWLWRHSFPTSTVHWQRHYEHGGDSGPGSYGEYATYKANLINQVVRERSIRSIIELGCGDGNQLGYLKVDQYIGLDISKIAIKRCVARYGGDPTRSFIWYNQDYFHDPLRALSADCAMSLDVIFHLIEDDVFFRYMQTLFNCGRRFVMIYGWDEEEKQRHHVSVRVRKYSAYIAANIPNFRVALHVAKQGRFSDFYLYERMPNSTE
jgi:SAM-dependent methyltransferase